MKETTNYTTRELTVVDRSRDESISASSFRCLDKERLSSSQCSKKDSETRREVCCIRKARKWVDTAAALLALISIIISLMQVRASQNDVTYDGNVLGKIPLDTAPDPFRCGLYAVSFVLSNFKAGIFVLCHYYLTVRILRLQGSFCIIDVVDFQGDLLPKMCLEVLICAISSPVTVESSFTAYMTAGSYRYSVDDILTLFSLLKGYLLFRLFLRHSKWTSSSSKPTCARYKVSPTLLFALKCELKHRPYVLITVLFLSVTLSCGCAARILERSYIGPGCVIDLGQLTNDMWMVIITMTTVGYGDGYPSTHVGRLVSSMACILGMVLTSLVVIALTNLSAFEPTQLKAFYAIKTQATHEKILHLSATAIKQAFALRKSMNPYRLQASMTAVTALNATLESIKELRQCNSDREQNSRQVETVELIRQLQERMTDRMK